jgi:hypothetical protein
VHGVANKKKLILFWDGLRASTAQGEGESSQREIKAD